MMITNILHPQSADGQQTRTDYLLSPNTVVLYLQDGTARLLDLSGNFYALSQTGAAMLSATLEQGSALATQSIASTYHVDSASIERDLQAFLANLEARHLLFRAEQPLPSSRRAGLAKRLFPPLLHCICARSLPLNKRAWLLLMFAYVSTHLFGWPATVLAWQRSLQSIAPGSRSADVESDTTMIRNAVQTAISKFPWRVACKERSLSCWYLLRSLGLPAQLLVGVNLCPFSSHCWCELDAVPFCDEKGRRQEFTPILSYE